MSTDPIKYAKERLAEVEEQTRKAAGVRVCVTWEKQTETWLRLFQSSLRDLNESDRINSMTVFRLSEFWRLLLWIWMNTVWGQYHTTLREMRYVLESLIQAYYLDMEHPEATIECRLEILKEMGKWATGSRIIERSRLDNGRRVKQPYLELCKYAHGSYEELEPAITGGDIGWRIRLAFNQELFDKCEDFTKRLMDAVYFILLRRFPQSAKVAKMDQSILDFLKASNCTLTLSLLDSGQAD